MVAIEPHLIPFSFTAQSFLEELCLGHEWCNQLREKQDIYEYNRLPSACHCPYVPYSWNLQQLFRACHHPSWRFRSVDCFEVMSMWSHMTCRTWIHDPYFMLSCRLASLLCCFSLKGIVNQFAIFGLGVCEHQQALFFPLFLALLFVLLDFLSFPLRGLCLGVNTLLAIFKTVMKGMALCFASKAI